jgi:hypothetical protein
VSRPAAPTFTPTFAPAPATAAYPGQAAPAYPATSGYQNGAAQPGTGGFPGMNSSDYQGAGQQANWPGGYGPSAQQAGVARGEQGYGTAPEPPQQQGYWDGDQQRGNWT